MTQPLALISGGTQGIGFGIADELKTEYRLALLYKSDTQRAQESVTLLRKNGALKAMAYRCDVADYPACEEVYKKIKLDFESAPRILVNCAGVASSKLALLESLKAFHEIMGVNYFGVVNLCKLAAPDMMRAKFGRIINLSSASVGNSTRGHSAYAASKAAMEKFSSILGGELSKYGVTVNSVRPFVVLTRMTQIWYDTISADSAKRDQLLAPSGQLTDMASVAKAVQFLIDSPQINCTSLTIDGGNANFINI